MGHSGQKIKSLKMLLLLYIMRYGQVTIVYEATENKILKTLLNVPIHPVLW